MQINFVEIQNFRKLKSIRIEFAAKTTLFVGANNSGKTSAMEALISFLNNKKFSTNDLTLSNWEHLNKIGSKWEEQSTLAGSQIPTVEEWGKVLPAMDVWLEVRKNEIYNVIHLLPTLDWDGGLLGIRLRLEPKKIEDFYKEYLLVRKSARDTIKGAKEIEGNDVLELWPKNMIEFLDRYLNSLFVIRAYILDPKKCNEPKNGIAQPQTLPIDSEYLDGDPLRGLILIDDITAQRGLSDVGNERGQADNDGEQYREHSDKRKLSVQLRKYYNRHLDPSDLQEPSDLEALEAIDSAQKAFNQKLKDGFSKALSELASMGYPGITDPKLTISTKIKPMDGLNHSSAVRFEVVDQSCEAQGTPLCLPEQYNGLGYQNLISMVFMLMGFRDGWMRVGKAEKRALAEKIETPYPLLHLVLVEEPEVHLHAQVQQVFIRKAYDILRNHDNLKNSTNLTTQLVVSTHSSHIAHECEFSSLRYFRRLPAQKDVSNVPITTVVNLSEVFGKDGNTQRFVARYLKTTHCDLFFADAAILVEGSAERMLIPHFIYQDFKELNQNYITILEISGSHAHRLRPLIEHLGLTALIITDLDAAKKSTGKWISTYPARNEGLITRNMVLRAWVPKKKNINELLDLKETDKVKVYDNIFSICVAYQCPIDVLLSQNGTAGEALSNTFEDALVFDNVELFRSLNGVGLIKKFKEAIDANSTTKELGKALFELLKNGDKAEFALDLLFLKNSDKLKVPTYIKNGLSWLQERLQITQQEVLIPSKKLVAGDEGVLS